MSTRFLPVLVSVRDRAYDEMNVLDEYLDEVGVGYTVGPPYGERLVTWSDLDRIELPRRRLRREAMDNLETMSDAARIHGQPPALWLSFDGMESSLLLVDEFWDDVSESIPGETVVGVPARDVVLITGSESRTGLAKAARAIDRVFYANRPNLLLRELLVWRDGQWQAF
ncbi:MAG TPA: DUF1444 family protein [Rugosimonospora sp.]|nr:DUF1444 family protein [Rugosimonospora sp.]